MHSAHDVAEVPPRQDGVLIDRLEQGVDDIAQGREAEETAETASERLNRRRHRLVDKRHRVSARDHLNGGGGRNSEGGLRDRTSIPAAEDHPRSGGIVPIQFWTRYCVSSTESVSRSRVSVMKSSAICAMVRVSPSKIVPEVPVPL